MATNNEIEKRFLHAYFTGDNEKLCIWDVERKKAYQVIGDELERWGQVTCIQWLHGFSENCQVISFGTGQGLFLIYQQEKDAVSFSFCELTHSDDIPAVTGSF